MGNGLYDRQELLRLGVSDRQIRVAVADGRLIRIREGLFATSELDAVAVRSLQLGGVPDCLTELERLGAWVLRDGRLHVRYGSTAARVRSAAGVVRHWREPVGGSTGVGVGVVNALVQAIHCVAEGAAVVVLDSALNLKLIDDDDLLQISRTSQKANGIVAKCDEASESGLETLIRLLAKALGLHVEVQVRFEGVGRVDVVLEHWVVVESDGDEFHSDVRARRRDRRRDAALVALGRSVLRFGYDQIVGEPRSVALAMIEAVRQHRGVKDAGAIADRAAARLETLDLSWIFDARPGVAPVSVWVRGARAGRRASG